MFRFFCPLICVIPASLYSYAQQDKDNGRGIYLADPTVFFHKGNYYLYGTDGSTVDSGFHFLVSKDLQTWSPQSNRALTRGKSYGTKGFWAPQVFEYRHKCYMAYTANENIAIAESKDPGGPFIQKSMLQLEAPVKQIDPFIFRDDDGKLYLYHVRLQDGNRIFGAELEKDLSAIKTTTLRECISAVVNSQSWENTASAKWTVTEGPTVFKKDGLYYMLYSANDFRNPDYAVGYATATHPLGPWVKYAGNPLISRNTTSVNGSGHGDLLEAEDGNMYYIFHTHHTNEKVAPRRTAILQLRFENNIIRVEKASFRYLTQPGL